MWCMVAEKMTQKVNLNERLMGPLESYQNKRYCRSFDTEALVLYASVVHCWDKRDKKTREAEATCRFLTFVL